MEFSAKIPFINNININCEKELNILMNKCPNYEDFYRYYKKQWIPILKDKILNLKNVDIKIRTNNSIENFNKIFKQSFIKKGSQEPVYFLETIMSEVCNHEIYINKLNSKNIKNISISKKLNKKNLNNNHYNKEIKDIIEEIENISFNNLSDDNALPNQISLENIDLNETDFFNNKNKYKNKKFNKWLLNYKNSCYLDSFYTIFVFAILPKFLKCDIYKNFDFKNSDDIHIKNFYDIIKFSKYLLQQIKNDFILFFDLYIKYQSDIDNNCLLLKEEEIGCENSITICYRPFEYIDIFRLKYKSIRECNGKCKYAKTIKETLYTKSYLELTEGYLSEKILTNIKDFILEYFNDRNVSCNEDICLRDNMNYKQNFKYEILDLPLILSIYISMEYNKLCDFKNTINNLLRYEFEIYSAKYELVGVIIMISSNHFISLCKNSYLGLNLNLGQWFYHDDMNGYIKPIDELGLNNILNNYCINLLIYMLK